MVKLDGSGMFIADNKNMIANGYKSKTKKKKKKSAGKRKAGGRKK